MQNSKLQMYSKYFFLPKEETYFFCYPHSPTPFIHSHLFPPLSHLSFLSFPTMKDAKPTSKSFKTETSHGKGKRTEEDDKTFCMCRADEEQEREWKMMDYNSYDEAAKVVYRNRRFKNNVLDEVQSMSYLKATVSGSAPVIMASLKAAVIREVKQTFRVEIPDIQTAALGGGVYKRDRVSCGSSVCSSMARLKATVVRGIESAFRVGVAGMGSLTMASLKAAVVEGVREVLAENGVKEHVLDALCMGIGEGIEKLGEDMGGGSHGEVPGVARGEQKIGAEK